jgi:hypothetical protein
MSGKMTVWQTSAYQKIGLFRPYRAMGRRRRAATTRRIRPGAPPVRQMRAPHPAKPCARTPMHTMSEIRPNRGRPVRESCASGGGLRRGFKPFRRDGRGQGWVAIASRLGRVACRGG